MKRILLIGAAALSLAACATTPSAQTTEAQGIAASWSALDGVANTLDGLATSKVLTGKNALTAAQDLEDAKAALLAATAAYNAGQGASAQQNVATATALIAALIAIAQHPTQ